MSDGERGDRLHERGQVGAEKEEAEHEEQMVAAREDVFEADAEVVDEDVEPALLCGYHHLGFAAPQHALNLTSIGELDADEGVDPRRSQAVDADGSADESFATAVDLPAGQQGDAFFIEPGRREGRALDRKPGFDAAFRVRRVDDRFQSTSTSPASRSTSCSSAGASGWARAGPANNTSMASETIAARGRARASVRLAASA